jgi:ethanolamine ammonia-lyase small subunit
MDDVKPNPPAPPAGAEQTAVAGAPDPGHDPWVGLRRFTAARIALGRAGGSQRTTTLLDFRLSHAQARDAVHAGFDAGRLAAHVRAAGEEVVDVTTGATDRRAYLLRPDLGRRLSAESRTRLAGWRQGREAPDLVLIVSDGLAAQAAERHALGVVSGLGRRLRKAGWRVGPVVVAPFGRVKLQDEIGEILGARYSLMLLGERPGLSAPDGLGAYFTRDPGRGKTDADRNCVSNIRVGGIAPDLAAEKLARLLIQSSQTGLGGVALKDEDPSASGGEISG